MSHDTVQVRLAQPPSYLMGAVVLASLLPLFAQFFGAADGVERLRRLGFAGMDVQQLEPRNLAVVSLAHEASGEDEGEGTDEVEVEVEVIESQPVVESVTSSKRASSRKKPSVVAKARSACARNDKDSARAAYKSLERGDPRRRTIRKSCRKSGVWFL